MYAAIAKRHIRIHPSDLYRGQLALKWTTWFLLFQNFGCAFEAIGVRIPWKLHNLPPSQQGRITTRW